MANNKIQVKRTSVSGRTANVTSSGNSQYIDAGELALNMADGILYSSNGSSLITIGSNLVNQSVTNTLTVASATTANSIGVTTTGFVNAAGIVSGSELTSTLASGDEGGQINLAKPPNGTTNGNIIIDAYQSRIRIYEAGSPNRGAYIDLTAAANGVGSNLLTGGGGGGGTVTSVGTGNGLTGGPITGSGTISVLANTGIVANTTGVYVNATYIGTISANNASFLGGTAAANFVQNTDSRTLSGNLVFSGANVNFTGNARITGGLIANGALGSAADVLTSNGSSVYWAPVSGGSSNAVYMKGGAATIGTLAAGGSNIFRVNANTLSYDTTIASGENAQATGPLAIASGITLTISSGARVAIS